MATSQSPNAPSKSSLMEDFVDIFTSPSEVFKRREGTTPWLALVILVILAAVLYFATKGIMQPAMDAEWARVTARVAAKNPAAAAQMESARGVSEKFGAVFLLVGIPISMALTGLCLWLVGMAVGSKAKAGDAIMVAIYAWTPRLFGFIAAAVIMMMVDPASVNSAYSATLSVARFLNPDTTPPALFALAARADLFIFWQTALLAIGLSAVGRIPRAQAWMAAAMVWVLGALPQLIGALRQ